MSDEIKKLQDEHNEIVLDLVRALHAMLEVQKQLMPGILHIACTDYAVINEGPILAGAALRRAADWASKVVARDETNSSEHVAPEQTEKTEE